MKLVNFLNLGIKPKIYKDTSSITLLRFQEKM
jgi:hypothetical protein